jgi:hypothetical protein
MATDEFHGHRLPAFPVDDSTLDLLHASLFPRSEGERSSLYDFLDFMSQLGGSDTGAVKEQLSEHTRLMRDEHYSHYDVIAALVEEIRRLRRELL